MVNVSNDKDFLGSDPAREDRDMIDRVMGAEPLRVEQSLSVPDDDHQEKATTPPLPEDGSELDELMAQSEGEAMDRADVIGEGARWFAGWCLRFLIVGLALYVSMWALGKIWTGLLPVLLALIVATVLGPPAAWLMKHRWPRAMAALVTLVGSLALVTGVFALMAPTVRAQAPHMVDQFTQGIIRLQEMLQKPPFNVEDEQLLDLVDQATTWLQERSGDIANTVFQGISVVGSVAITLVVMLVLLFFMIKDGQDFLPWVRSIAGRRLGWHLTEVLTRSWNTLGGFIRTQAVVSLIDAIFIGLGLWLLDVPLALVLAVLTFFAGFIPIVGAFTAGFVAVVVALVANGLTTAILALVLIIVVQQVEGNILSPVLQSKAMNLHAAIVLLSVTLGSTIFGIIGAFLAVPVAAVVAVWFRYLGDLTDLRTGDKTAADIKFATEAGTVTGVQEEAAGRALRERLATLRFGHDADKEASAQTAGELEEEVGAVATARPASGRHKSDGEGNGASGNGNGNHRGDGADHGPFGGRGRTVGNMLNKVTGTITGRFRRR